MIDRICYVSVHPFGDFRDDVTVVWMFATGKLGNKSNQIFYDLTGYMICISGYKQTLVRFHLRSYENEKRYFLVVPDFSCNFGKMIFSIIFCQT